jgi:putative hydrolase of the HAD superfamily
VKNYKAIFFDLDHTLWDFERNSTEALMDIYSDMDLYSKGIPSVAPFIANYQAHNKKCWELYRDGKLDKEDLRGLRFELALKDYQIHDRDLANEIGEEYVKRSPYKTNLFPAALEVLDYLKKSYRMFIITNGFEEIQYIKMKQSGLEPFFESVITSEKAGVRKPHRDIFEHALNVAGYLHHEVIMVGDDLEADVIGARNMNMDAILFDPKKENSPSENYKTIHHLNELQDLL